MSSELIRKILLLTEKTPIGKSWHAGKSNIPEELGDIEWYVLDEYLAYSWKEGFFICAIRSDNEWQIRGLTIKAIDTLGTITATEALQEANKISRRANRIAVWSIIGFLFCAVVSLPFLADSVASWMKLFGW